MGFTYDNSQYCSANLLLMPLSGKKLGLWRTTSFTKTLSYFMEHVKFVGFSISNTL